MPIDIKEHIPQTCRRLCFFKAFAEEAKCANFEVIELPDVQKMLVAEDRICDLTIGGITC